MKTSFIKLQNELSKVEVKYFVNSNKSTNDITFKVSHRSAMLKGTLVFILTQANFDTTVTGMRLQTR